MTLPFVAWVAIAGCVVREERFLLVHRGEIVPDLSLGCAISMQLSFMLWGYLMSYFLCLLVSYRSDYLLNIDY